MEQRELIPEIRRLCEERKYNEAIQLTNKISDKQIAIKAHLLCIEHESVYLRSLNK